MNIHNLLILYIMINIYLVHITCEYDFFRNCTRLNEDDAFQSLLISLKLNLIAEFTVFFLITILKVSIYFFSLKKILLNQVVACIINTKYANLKVKF